MKRRENTKKYRIHFISKLHKLCLFSKLNLIIVPATAFLAKRCSITFLGGEGGTSTCRYYLPMECAMRKRHFHLQLVNISVAFGCHAAYWNSRVRQEITVKCIIRSTYNRLPAYPGQMENVYVYAGICSPKWRFIARRVHWVNYFLRMEKRAMFRSLNVELTGKMFGFLWFLFCCVIRSHSVTRGYL